MSSFEICTTSFCRNMCKYCPQKALLKGYHGTQIMSLDTFKTCIDKLPPISIHFSGFAEPFQNPNCTKMIQYANLRQYPISLYTTLASATTRDIELLQPVDFVIVAIHLPDNMGLMHLPVTLDYITVLYDAISMLKNVSVHCLGDVHFDLANNPLLGTLSTGVNIIPLKNLHTRANNFDGTSLGINNNAYKSGPIHCRVGLDNHVLLPNGDVVLCCMDFGIKHIIGNLLYDSYEDLHKSSEYLRIVDAQKNGGDILCRKCQDSVQTTLTN